LDYQDLDEDWPLVPVPGYPPVGRPTPQDAYDGNHDTPKPLPLRYGGVSLRAEADIGSLTLMSLTAWRAMTRAGASTSTRGRSP
jgi:hypothetical protein